MLLNWQYRPTQQLLQRGRRTEGHQKTVEAMETGRQKQDERDETARVLEETTTRGASAGRKCQKRKRCPQQREDYVMQASIHVLMEKKAQHHNSLAWPTPRWKWLALIKR